MQGQESGNNATMSNNANTSLFPPPATPPINSPARSNLNVNSNSNLNIRNSENKPTRAAPVVISPKSAISRFSAASKLAATSDSDPERTAPWSSCISSSSGNTTSSSGNSSGNTMSTTQSTLSEPSIGSQTSHRPVSHPLHKIFASYLLLLYGSINLAVLPQISRKSSIKPEECM